jgi:hypothetical protein
MAGPMRKARFAIVSVSARASWMSPSGTVCGSRPLYAGWKNACAAPKPASIRTICQIAGRPARIITASAPCSSARVPSVATMIR